MNNPDPNFTTRISVDQSPEEAFAAINNPRGWWSENIEGSTAKLGDEWTYRYKDVHRSELSGFPNLFLVRKPPPSLDG
jgi:hypothetical protein